MTTASRNVRLVCEIGGDDETAFLSISLTSGKKHKQLLAFSEITEELNSLKMLNETINLYEDHEKLKSDLAKLHLDSFMSMDVTSNDIYKLLAAKLYLQHQNGTCTDTCHYCNPDLNETVSTDPLYDLKMAHTKGSA